MKNSTSKYWQLFFQTLVSLQFHWFSLKGRIKANWVDAPPYRCLMSLIFTVAVLVVVTTTNCWTTFLVALVFPLSGLYHISTLCQICSEHLWGATGSIESKSHGRFCGESPPLSGSVTDWLGWILRMLCYHLPVRIAILSDPEICQHDLHHNFPRADKDWANATYSRQAQVEAGAEYREYWGLHNALEAVFQSLADTPSLSEEEIQRLISNK